MDTTENANPDKNAVDPADLGIDVESYFTSNDIPVIEKQTPKKEPVDKIGDKLEDIFNPLPKDTDTPDENLGDENLEDEEEQADTEQAEPQVVLELKVEGKTETYDLSKPEQKALLVQFAQKGKHYEQKMAEFNTEKSKTLTAQQSQAIGLAFQEMFLQSQGKLNHADYLELPYEQFEGRTDTTQGDIEAWNAHKAEVTQRRTALQDYAKSRQETEAKFEVIQEDFFAKHKEIENAEEWMEKYVYPLHAPVYTFGKVPYPSDILDMVWFWHNRNEVFQAMMIKQNAKKADKTNDHPGVTGRSGNPGTPKKAFDKYVDKVFRVDKENPIVN